MSIERGRAGRDSLRLGFVGVGDDVDVDVRRGADGVVDDRAVQEVVEPASTRGAEHELGGVLAAGERHELRGRVVAGELVVATTEVGEELPVLGEQGVDDAPCPARRLGERERRSVRLAIARRSSRRVE